MQLATLVTGTHGRPSTPSQMPYWCPLGIVEQDTINEYGKIIPKWQLMHDMSFDVMKSTYQSVNHQVICEELTPCHYGTAILCHIHFIVHLRLQNPTS
jgi:hypothetical protein